jgi:hypothetical protein
MCAGSEKLKHSKPALFGETGIIRHFLGITQLVNERRFTRC